jgi:hypothetical protein
MSLALLCLLIVIYPLFAGPGPVHTRGGGDSPFLLIRLEQLVAGLRAGAFPVRWMPDAAYGLGYPFFNFYAALPYYVAAVFRLLGWGPILSLQFTQTLGFVLAAAAAALLARRVFRHPAAVTLAVVAYTCAPFHLVNVYVRGDSLSEFYAFVFYPLILWALLRLRDHPSWPNVAWLALSYGGLILTHNLSAAIFTPFAIGYALLLVWQPNRKRVSNRSPLSAIEVRRNAPQPHARRSHAIRRLDWSVTWRMVAGVALGLALSACLWFTTLDDLDAVWMGHKAIQTSGYFNYEGHLRGGDLVQPALLFDYDVAPGNTPFAMGAMQAALVLVSVLVLGMGWLRRDRTGNLDSHASPAAGFWIAGFALCTFMITSASKCLWDHLPVLPIIQFPWRFLSVQALFGALIVGELAQRLPRPWWVAAICALPLMTCAVGGLRPEYLPIQEADVTPERLALFESFTANVGTTIRGEYLPSEVEPQPFASTVTLHRGQKPPPAILAGQVAQATLVEHDALSERWRVTVSSEQAHLAFYTFYFPGWRALVDGRTVEIEPLSNSGLMSLYLPGGEHEVTLRFGRTPARWIADLVSLVTLVLVTALTWPSLRSIKSVRWPHARAAIMGGAAILGTVLLGGILSVPRWTPSAGDLSMDFDRMPFLHHNPDGIDFSGRARMVVYAYGAESVHGGDTLTVTLTWKQADSNLLADVHLVTPADAHPRFAPPPPPLASAHAHIEEQTTIHALTIPTDAASGPYYVSLHVLDGESEVQALTAQGHTLGTTYLRPVWIDNPRPAREGDPVRANLRDRILLRDDVQVEGDGENWNVRLTWQAVTCIPVNYTCSLRMLAADGTPISQAHRDFEGGPGHGFWPTSAWPVGEWVTDRLRVPVPSGVRARDAAALVIVLYDRSQPGFPAAGSVVVPLSEREHLYNAPEMEQEVGVTFGEQVRLLGYDLDRDTTAIHLTLHWQATRQMLISYTMFAHLFDPATETIVSQADVKPLNGTYPTNWWRVGEVISDEVILPLADVPAGSYALAVGLYDTSDGTRLPVVTPTEDRLPDGRLVLQGAISIVPDP